MAIKVFSGILILLMSFLGMRHGWQSLTMSSAQAHAALGLDFSRGALIGLGILSLLSAVLILFPQTFLVANVITGCSIFYLTALQCTQRNIRGALIEIPFLLLPLVVLFLGHPFKK